ncbi:hypothetical protein IV203_007828 [Nitzschia inconspicua]|uniref:Uncharacterized protein n=1 Tax=Nitzschia inconspicua TaxID=303405 RepID=A0A9K3KZ90_9STRA|nr:hypothetical protein IV203_007828 [Nitzschia inconspicua]
MSGNEFDCENNIDGPTSNNDVLSQRKIKDRSRMDRIKAKAKESAIKDLQLNADDFDPQVLADMLGLPVSVFYGDGKGIVAGGIKASSEP